VRYRVVAPYITARSAEAVQLLPSPWRRDLALSGYHAGVLLPESVPAEDISNMLRAGLIEPVPEDS
jgi:hypothetical protein